MKGILACLASWDQLAEWFYTSIGGSKSLLTAGLYQTPELNVYWQLTLFKSTQKLWAHFPLNTTTHSPLSLLVSVSRLPLPSPRFSTENLFFLPYITVSSDNWQLVTDEAPLLDSSQLLWLISAVISALLNFNNFHVCWTPAWTKADIARGTRGNNQSI